MDHRLVDLREDEVPAKAKIIVSTKRLCDYTSRNEEVNLPKILSALQEQSYPNFEIIVVNDNSTDKTRGNCFIVQESESG